MSWRIRPAEAGDNDALLRLLEGTPQPGAVTLNFERRPDFFTAAGVACQQPDIWVAEHSRAPGELQAVFDIGWRRVFVDGEPRALRYAHDLRIAEGARGGMLLHRLFRHLRSQLEAGEWMQTVILEENQPSVATVGSGRAGLPAYYPWGEIETSLVYTRPGRVPDAGDISLRPASSRDLAALQQFWNRQAGRKQFMPCYDFECMDQQPDYYPGLAPGDFIVAESRAGEILGVVGTWDQKAFKQTRVVRYAPGMALLRHGYNAVSRVRGGLRLPPAGGTLSYLALHSIAVRDNDPELFHLLLRYCVHHFSADYDALVCGFFRTDPLSAVPARWRRRRLSSRHFLVSYDGDPRARLDTDRVPGVEVARL